MRAFIYMVLSRKFWVGIGVGFFLASLFLGTVVSASATPEGKVILYGAYALNHDPTGSTCATNKRFWAYTTATTAVLYHEGGAGNCTTARLYAYINSTTTWNVARGIEYIDVYYSYEGSCQLYPVTYSLAPTTPNLFTYGTSFAVGTTSGFHRFNIASTSGDSSSVGLGFGIFGYNGNQTCKFNTWSVMGSDGTEFVIKDTDFATGGGGGGATTTLFYPLGMSDRIDTMNCITTATSSVCTPIYATTTPFTTQEFFYLFFIFVVFVFVGFWTVKTFW